LFRLAILVKYRAEHLTSLRIVGLQVRWHSPYRKWLNLLAVPYAKIFYLGEKSTHLIRKWLQLVTIILSRMIQSWGNN